MADPVDEYALLQLQDFDGEKSKSVMKKGLDFYSENEVMKERLDVAKKNEKKTLDEMKAEFELLSKPVNYAKHEMPGYMLLAASAPILH